MSKKDYSPIEGLRRLQDLAPWTDLWSEDYKNDPRPYKDFEHCLTNMAQLVGKLLFMCEREDHYGENRPRGQGIIDNEEIKRSLAWLLMTSMKAANVSPLGKVDLAEFVEKDYKRRGVEID